MDAYLEENDTKALEIIKIEPVITRTRLATLLKCSERTVLRD
jgi:DeoR/GlpR family transcriptional regulator of sugar metabolism